MSIAPISKSVVVRISPERAFTAFTRDLGRWWPRDHGIGPRPQVSAVIEPHPGGRWYEVDAEGQISEWGKVLAWEPPHRVLLAWQIDARWKFDPTLVTEVEVRFVAEDGGTRVTLEHRDLERFGPSAREHAGRLGGGWPTLIDRFVAFIESKEHT